MDDEEYEVIPTSPIRRLEKRLSRIETTSTGAESSRLIEQIIELIKSNQRVIDDIIKSDAELRNEISKVPVKIDSLVDKMDEFLELLKASATEETVNEASQEMIKPLTRHMKDMVEQAKKNMEIQQASLVSLETIDKRLKRLYLQQPATQAATQRRYQPQYPPQRTQQ